MAAAFFFSSASSTSVIVARRPNCVGRSSGVMPLLAQTPWKSGCPSGVRGTDHDFDWLLTTVADRARPARMHVTVCPDMGCLQWGQILIFAAQAKIKI